MTSSNGNNSDRLDRIENILDRLAVGLEDTKAIANSNSRTIQGILDARATERLEHEEKMAVMTDAIQRLIRIEEAQNRMLAGIDENQPTILRKLTTIENKVDSLIERDR